MFGWIAVAGVWSVAASAAPAAPIETTLEQPGGDTFPARQFGDEWNNGFETPAGFTIVPNDQNGAWEYAEKVAEGELAPSGVRADQAPPSGVKKHLRPEDAPGLRPSAQTPEQAPQIEPPARSITNTGTQKSLVLLVQFQNQSSLGSTAAQWNSKFFGSTNSVKDYYDEVSYGTLNIAPATESHETANDGVVGWLTLGYNHPNTAGNTGTTNRNLTRDAVNAADPYINYASYDTNGDGFLSTQELHVTVIAAGHETSYSGACGNSVWGHQWALFGTERPTVDGVVFGDSSRGGGYTQFGEWHCDHMATIGIMVHEMGHDLYLPDLYDTDPTNGGAEGVGEWSVMGSGSWLATTGTHPGSTPPHPDPFSKSYQGWITPQQVSGNQVSTSVGQAATNATAIRLLDNPNGVDWTFNTNPGTGEYFLVENRQKVNYDAALPGCGLLIWHIDETRTATNFANSDETRKLVDVEEADGLNNLDNQINRGDAGDPFPGTSNKTVFNDTSNPNSKLYSGASSQVAVNDISNCAATITANMSTTSAVQGPANDNFANAEGLSGSSDTATGTNVNATKETGEPSHAPSGNVGGNSVWYTWTPQANGNATINTVGSGFDTLLGVYTGSAVSGLTAVAKNDDRAGGGTQSELSFTANADTTYLIAVDGYNDGTGAATGNITLNLSAESDNTPPSVSLTAPADNATVSGTSVTLSATASDNVGVSKVDFLVDGNLVNTDTNSPYSYAWNSQSVADGFVNITAKAYDATNNSTTSAARRVAVDNTTPNTTITANPPANSTSTSAAFEFSSTERDSTFRCSLDGAAYEACSSPKNYAGIPDGQHTFRAYAVGSGGATNDSDATPAEYAWNVDTQQEPANDDFANALALSGTSDTETGTNVGATKESGEPNHANNPGGKSVWYTWTPQASGNATINTNGSGFDTLLGVYTGSAVSGLSQVVADDGGDGTQSLVSFPTTVGTTYLIAVDGYNNDTGSGAANGNINLSLTSSAVDTTNPNVSLTAPAANAVVAGTAVTLSANANDNVGVSRVDFLVNNNVVDTDDSAPYSISWDSNTLADGQKTITASAFDAANNQATSAGRQVIVDNDFPNTSINSGPPTRTKKRTATFTFSSPDADVIGFQCSIDGKAWTNCSSPMTYSGLARKKHTFKVKAIGSAGALVDADPTPATRTWTIRR